MQNVLAELQQNALAELQQNVPATEDQAPSTDLDALLTTPMLADKLHMSPRTLEGWRVSGAGPPFLRIGPHKIVYRWRSILDWLNSQEYRSTSEEISPLKTIKRQFDEGVSS